MTDETPLDYPDTLEAAGKLLRQLSPSDDAEYRAEHILSVAASIDDTVPSRVAAFILEHLLPRCLSDKKGPNAEQSMRATRLRKLLAHWLDGLPDESLWSVRQQVLLALVRSLDESPSLAGVYSISAIGYRSPEVIDALRRAGSRDDDTGYEALRMLNGMSPQAEQRQWISHRLRQAYSQPKPYSDDFWTAVAQSHDLTWLPELTNAAIEAPHPLFAFARISWLIVDSPGDRATQSAGWEAIKKVAKSRSDGWQSLMFTGGVVGAFHSQKVLKSLSTALPRLAQAGPVHVRRWMDRVGELRSPVQLEGWNAIDPETVNRALKPFVQANSGGESVSQTIEGDAKGAALDALLCAGNRSTESVLELALSNEGNSYTKAEIFDRFAALSLASIPASVRTLISTGGPFHRSSRREDKLHLFLAATRLVASSATLESFRLLLSSAAMIDGHPFRRPAEAAAAQAAWLHEYGNLELIDELVSGLAEHQSNMSQTVCSRALAHLVERSWPPDAEQALRDASAHGRAPYVRLEAMRALVLHRISTSAVTAGSGDLENLLLRACSDEDRSVRWAAMSGLLRLGYLARHRQLVEEFAFSSDPPLSSDAETESAHIAGQLAAIEPETYAHRAAIAIANGSDGFTHSFLTGFRSAASENERLPETVATAALSRLHRNESIETANPPAFLALAILSPERMLEESWEPHWASWMPDSREALAAAIPRAARSTSGLGERAEELLVQLLGDGTFAVRRAAARSLSLLNIDALRTWTLDALESGAIGLRSRAAESASWLPVDSQKTLDNDPIRTASGDPERVVREAADRARVAIRRRLWAADLMQRITTPKSDANDWVLSSYAQGRALAQLGDDSDLLHLEEKATDATVPPNVRYWFAAIAKGLEEQWKKTTNDWPESWLPWRGVVEQVKGFIRQGQKDAAATFSLWLQRRGSPDEVSGWGGVAWLDDDSTFSLYEAVQAGYATIQLENRRPVQVLCVGTNGNRLVLTGNDPYPTS